MLGRAHYENTGEETYLSREMQRKDRNQIYTSNDYVKQKVKTFLYRTEAHKKKTTKKDLVVRKGGGKYMQYLEDSVIVKQNNTHVQTYRIILFPKTKKYRRVAFGIQDKSIKTE